MSDFIKVHWAGDELYLNAYAVSAIYPAGPDGHTAVDLKVEGQIFKVAETPKEIHDMVDAIVNGPPTGPVQIPNFPGMEKQ